MNLKERLPLAGRFALKHLGVSALIACLCGALVFFVWYPYPYDKLASGRELFALLISIDVVIGPLLSFVVYNAKKPRGELWRDLGAVFALQLLALGYGLHSVAQARPVWLAFEGDRFRVVAVPDIDLAELNKAPSDLARLSWTGPQTVGVKLIDGSDPEFLKSIELSIQGIHPAFRPQRWIPYEVQVAEVTKAAKPLSQLKLKHPEKSSFIGDAVRQAGLVESDLGYWPLASQPTTDWVVMVSLKDGTPKVYLPIDGW